jgi:hypothetical protein
MKSRTSRRRKEIEMIATVNGRDTIKSLASGRFRAHRAASFWIGDYSDFASAKRAIEIANSKGADDAQRGFYDGGVDASEDQHMEAHAEKMGTLFGHLNCVTQDDVNRTIIAGEPYALRGGVIVRI